jgi:hypothetical protein
MASGTDCRSDPYRWPELSEGEHVLDLPQKVKPHLGDFERPVDETVGFCKHAAEFPIATRASFALVPMFDRARLQQRGSLVLHPP